MTTTITTTYLPRRNLGIVSKCTLIGAKNIVVYSGKYCVVNTGKKSQSEAFSHCKALNARLPLPNNDAEMNAFFEFSPNETWIDIRDVVSGQNLL